LSRLHFLSKLFSNLRVFSKNLTECFGFTNKSSVLLQYEAIFPDVSLQIIYKKKAAEGRKDYHLSADQPNFKQAKAATELISDVSPET